MTGTKEKRFKTHQNRWGEGKVHYYWWDPLNKMWYVPCTRSQPYGEVVPSDTPLTCKKCQRGMFAK